MRRDSGICRRKFDLAQLHTQAGGLMIGRDFFQQNFGSHAFFLRVFATRRKRTTGDWLREIGWRTGNCVKLFAFFVQRRDRSLQCLIIRMLWLIKDLFGRRAFHDPSGDMIRTRSQNPETMPMSCVMKITAVPSSCCILRMSSRICAWTVTSRAVVGSSAMSSFGFVISAVAIMTRWRIPPENSCGYARIDFSGILNSNFAQSVSAKSPCFCTRSFFVDN